MKKILILIFCLFLGQIMAQERQISGKVTDLKGNPLAGVTITAKDYPSLTTISGVDGEFMIVVFDFTKALIFSFSGMRTKEVPLGDLDKLLVLMQYLPLKNPDPWSFILNINIGNSKVYNKAKDEDPNWGFDGKAGFMSSIEVEYFFTQNMGIVTGLGFNAYNSEYYVYGLDNENNTISRIDQDNDQFYLYSLGTNVDERIKIRTLGIPLRFKFRLRPGRKWSYYADIGFKFMTTFSAKVEANGYTEWQGYYPQYHVVIDDVPAYDYTDYDINSENSLIDYQKTTVSFIGSIGVSRRLDKELNLDFGLFFERGMSDIKYDQPVHQADFLNTVGTIDKTFLNAFGLMVGLRYHLKKKR